MECHPMKNNRIEIYISMIYGNNFINILKENTSSLSTLSEISLSTFAAGYFHFCLKKSNFENILNIFKYIVRYSGSKT